MSAVLVALIDIAPSLDEEFNAWYDTEHVPERLAIPGITGASRWHLTSGTVPRYAAVFRAESTEVLAGGPYQAMKTAGDSPWTTRMRARFEAVVRGVFPLVADYGGSDGPGGFLALAITDVPPVLEARYAEWYDDQHGPAVAGVPGITAMARYARDEGMPRHLTLVRAADVEVFAGAAYAAAKAGAPGSDLRAAWTRSQGVYRLLAEWS